MNSSHVPRLPARQAGFTLVELMVGVVIAMLGVILMMEVLINSDERSRTTTSGNDSLSNGAVMLHLMQHDLDQAGYGVNALRLLGCSLTLPNGATVPLAPVVINPDTALVPAGDAHTDTMLVLYGNDNGQPEGNAVSPPAAGTTYTVQSPSSFHADDYVVAYPASCASALRLARVTAIGSLTVTVNTADANATVLYNLGRTPRAIAYAVRNGALTSCDFMQSDCRVNNAANWTAVAGDIVSLRAQYGRDTAPSGAMDGAVDVWDQTTPTTACTWARATAVRLVLVARSSQYESRFDATTGKRVCDPVTSTTGPTAKVLTWSGSTGTSTAPIDLTAAADWQCYRYKNFETVAPARNIVWMGTQAGC